MADGLSWQHSPEFYGVLRIALIVGGTLLIAFAVARLNPERGELPFQSDEPAEIIVNEPDADESDEAQPVEGGAERKPAATKIIPASCYDDAEPGPTQEAAAPEPEPRSALEPAPASTPEPEIAREPEPEADRKRLANSLRSALDDLPAARQILSHLSLSIDTADESDPEMLTEAARVMACWQWLSVVGVPKAEIVFLLGQLGGRKRQSADRLRQMMRAVGKLSPPIIDDDNSRRATEGLLAAMVGEAELIWPRAGDSFDRAIHTKRTAAGVRGRRLAVAAIICPGYRQGKKIVLPAVVETSAKSMLATAAPPDVRPVDAPFIDLLAEASPET